ncbi:MAG TPA: hypothetical protein VM452_02940 [Caulifigura sp.]|jgi:hypothetical protein|nr:hypothetical protein [Caulifigura sp.]
MFAAGTLVNVPHFRGKPLLVVGTEGASTRCLWSSESGEMGEVTIPSSLLQEVTPPASAASPPPKIDLNDSVPADWFRKNMKT